VRRRSRRSRPDCRTVPRAGSFVCRPVSRVWTSARCRSRRSARTGRRSANRDGGSPFGLLGVVADASVDTTAAGAGNMLLYLVRPPGRPVGGPGADPGRGGGDAALVPAVRRVHHRLMLRILLEEAVQRPPGLRRDPTAPTARKQWVGDGSPTHFTYGDRCSVVTPPGPGFLGGGEPRLPRPPALDSRRAASVGTVSKVWPQASEFEQGANRIMDRVADADDDHERWAAALETRVDFPDDARIHGQAGVEYRPVDARPPRRPGGDP